MNYIKVFISHSSEERKVAGLLKDFLQEYCGYQVYLAHDDLIPATDFKEGIIKAIKESDFFIPLFSDLFSQSIYTDQEVGIAIGVDKKIIPVKMGINPYGLLSDYQALSVHPDSIESLKELASKIGILALKHYSGDYGVKAKNSIIKALENSPHFRTSNIIIKILCECPKFSKKQVLSIINAIKRNYEVQGAFGLSSLRQLLKSRYKIEVETFDRKI